MRRTYLVSGVAVAVLACDPVQTDQIRLTPLPLSIPEGTSAIDRVAGNRLRAEAADSVEQIALRFGLSAIKAAGECSRTWRLSTEDRVDPGKSYGNLSVCVGLPRDGNLYTRLGEGPAASWSAKGDSLRIALADALARFGAVKRVDRW